ncbi:MAG: 16S rRNA (guanine(527)-N(7))-methyltransferase RsmG [Puniceicoccales bacterium]|nr:16S rRNA (guanine(527)-N(7))-methyltransferase RsmG [Puniceicoccales bacterium]
MQIPIAIIKQFFPEFSETMLDQLGYFCELVYAKNEVLNLISRKDIGRIVEAHLLPSLAICKQDCFEPGMDILDIGTGGGFPGIPLAIAMPQIRFTLIDSVGKKIRAVEEFIKKIKLEHVTCIHSRVEHLDQRYQYITGRAVAPLPEFYNWAKQKLKPNGKIFYLTGGDIYGAKNRVVVDLFELYGRRFCETKKLIIFSPSQH